MAHSCSTCALQAYTACTIYTMTFVCMLSVSMVTALDNLMSFDHLCQYKIVPSYK